MIELAKENIERVIERIREIGGDRITFIALYGSVTKNRDTPLSDIDLKGRNGRTNPPDYG